MKEKKIKVEYIISGKGKYEKTELGGIKVGEKFNLGNDSMDTIKVEEINDDSCVLLFNCHFLEVQPNRGEYIDIIEKDERTNLNIPRRVYRMTVKLNEEISFEPPMHPSPTYNMKIISIYEEERTLWR